MDLWVRFERPGVREGSVRLDSYFSSGYICVDTAFKVEIIYEYRQRTSEAIMSRRSSIAACYCYISRIRKFKVIKKELRNTSSEMKQLYGMGLM
jgi:hypothetical protein